MALNGYGTCIANNKGVKSAELKTRNLAKWLCCDCETALYTQTNHCSAKHEKKVKVNNSQWQWVGCIMADVCMKFYSLEDLVFEQWS